VLAECVRIEFFPTEMRLGTGEMAGAEADHVSVWKPAELPLEPPGNAHARIKDLAPSDELTTVERGAEGRQIVVEASADSTGDRPNLLGPGRNRFLIRRPSHFDMASLDGEWLAGRLHGIAVTAEELGGERLRDLLLWCGWRQSLLYLSGGDWPSVCSTVERRNAELTSPVVLVEPSLTEGGPPRPVPAAVGALVAESDRFFVLLAPGTVDLLAGTDLEPLTRSLLLGGPEAGQRPGGSAENEKLRYLTERTLLMRLRHVHGRSWPEVGRRVSP
jgi:hypothetical protein